MSWKGVNTKKKWLEACFFCQKIDDKEKDLCYTTL